MKSNLSKNQHFIPDFMIKKWSNNQNKIIIFCPDEIKIISLEEKIAKIEQKYAILTKKLSEVNKEKNCDIDNNDCTLITIFLFYNIIE